LAGAAVGSESLDTLHGRVVLAGNRSQTPDLDFHTGTGLKNVFPWRH